MFRNPADQSFADEGHRRGTGGHEAAVHWSLRQRREESPDRTSKRAPDLLERHLELLLRFLLRRRRRGRGRRILLRNPFGRLVRAGLLGSNLEALFADAQRPSDVWDVQADAEESLIREAP